MGNILELVNAAVIAGLIVFGFYVVLQNMRTIMCPQKKGTIASMGGLDNQKCNLCAYSMEPGKSTIQLKVKLDNGLICEAEASPCCLCMDRMKIGDRVGLTQSGNRLMAQKIGWGV